MKCINFYNNLSVEFIGERKKRKKNRKQDKNVIVNVCVMDKGKQAEIKFNKF